MHIEDILPAQDKKKWARLATDIRTVLEHQFPVQHDSMVGMRREGLLVDSQSEILSPAVHLRANLSCILHGI